MAAPKVRVARKPKNKDASKSKLRSSNNFQFSRTRDFDSAEYPIPSAAEDRELSDPEEFSDSSDESEAAGEVALSSAYTTLLQALNPSSSTEPPPAKKRRLVKQSVDTKNDAPEEPSHNARNPASSNLEEIDEPEAEVDGADSVNGSADDLDQADDDALNKNDKFNDHFNPEEDRLHSLLTEVINEERSAPSKSLVSPSWKVLASGPASLTSHAKPRTVEELGIKPKLYSRAVRNAPDLGQPINSLVAQSLFSYEDAFYCDRSISQSHDLRQMTALHALNHVIKTRDRVVKNNERLGKRADDPDGDYRDQGFTRPKVLYLLPTRQSCAKVVDALMQFCDPEQQENKKRFQDAYDNPRDSIPTDKPEDFRELFEGNDDDMFRIGLKFTRKTIKFFSQFYNSDIILASPLGLRMAIGPESSSKQDHDFLSSIELVVLDQAEAMLMQNWDHVEYIFSHLNLQPKEAHGCDFSRVRSWYLDGNARYLRQTVIFSAFNTPEINKLYNNYMLNVAGRVKISKETHEGTIGSFDSSFKQTFLRFDALEPSSDPDARFKYFTTKTVPNIAKRSQTGSGPHGILIFVPSYLDFVRARNYLAGSMAAQNIAFGSISEYSQPRDVARARSHFLTGRHAVLLYSGRAHHFRRYRIKGVKSVFFYALPDNAIFYKELTVDFLGRSLAEGLADQHELNSQALFSKWDAMRLERIVGTERVSALLRDNGDTFTFV